MSHIWTTVNAYIDIDTGEIITKDIAESGKYILKNIKRKLRYDKKGKRYMAQTKEYTKRKYIQQELPYTY